MMTVLGEINYLAVLAAAVAAMVVGGIWYSPMLFANAWMAENKFAKKDLADPKQAMTQTFIANVVLAFGLAALFLLLAPAPSGFLDGAKWGIALAILIHGMAALPNYAFENRSLRLFLIHLGNSAVTMAVMGGILAVWK